MPFYVLNSSCVVPVKEEWKGAKSRGWSSPQKRVSQNQGRMANVHVVRSKRKSLRSLSNQVCERSTSPRWDEGFHFLVRDPKEETLTVKVISSICVSILFNQLKMLIKWFVSVSSCLTVGARLWGPWRFPSETCCWSPAWCWTAGSTWTERSQKVRFCWGSC